MAIAPPVLTVVDQSPSAGIEPLRSIVSPNVVSSRTVNVIATLDRVQEPEGEVEVGFVAVVVVGFGVVDPPVEKGVVRVL